MPQYPREKSLKCLGVEHRVIFLDMNAVATTCGSYQTSAIDIVEAPHSLCKQTKRRTKRIFASLQATKYTLHQNINALKAVKHSPRKSKKQSRPLPSYISTIEGIERVPREKTEAKQLWLEMSTEKETSVVKSQEKCTRMSRPLLLSRCRVRGW